jgi:hypothetical protein
MYSRMIQNTSCLSDLPCIIIKTEGDLQRNVKQKMGDSQFMLWILGLDANSSTPLGVNKETEHVNKRLLPLDKMLFHEA